MLQRKICAFLIGLTILGGAFLPQAPADAAVITQPGSTGGDVWDLQYRLKTVGFYTTALDGIYGNQTKSAVARFQQQYGLSVDGIAGGMTWQAMRRVTLNRSEMDLLAKLIYSEARGEPYKGQVAVGAVVLNRIQSSQFPNDIRGVIFQPGAFTAVDDGQFWLTPDRTAYLAAMDAVRGWDPSGNALYYFNPATATSKWIWSRPQIVTIGNHIFTK
ncbi:spore cortex-lytic enzyme [Paenibacillus chartarius]|uniref:Spore cortex-lytic enzyme n=1 Tax=Paenibacillus chartarius TaxID=747481 RepID=A0ABV6DFA4_9BACL